VDGKRRAIEADHGLGHQLGASGQLEHGVRDATPNAREVGIGALTREIPGAATMAELTPEDQPATLYGSDLHEPAEILPGEDGTFVSGSAQ